MHVASSTGNIHPTIQQLRSSQEPRAQPSALNTLVDRVTARDTRIALRALSDFIDALSGLEKTLTGRESTQAIASSAISSQALGLDLTTTATTLTSSREINEAPTSYTPFGPDWLGGSTAELTLSGVYGGAQANDTLRFRSVNAGIRGVSLIRLQVRTSGNQVIANINVDATDPLDQQYDIGNGLRVHVGGGIVSPNDEAFFTVSSDVGSQFDPTLPFNGVRNSNPNFDESTGSISTGSFDLNGVNIAVSDNETLDDIIARINNSAAGITAIHDAINDRVQLLQQSTGSAPPMNIGVDSSGLIAALRLDDGILQTGKDPDDLVALDQLAQFSGVSAGNISVNGVQIAIDPAVDSLADILGRIESQSNDVSATFSPESQRVTLEVGGNQNSLLLAEGGTQFLSSIFITEGSYTQSATSGKVSQRLLNQVRDQLGDAVNAINRLLNTDKFSPESLSQVQQLQNSFLNTFRESFSGAGKNRTDLGRGIVINQAKLAANSERFLQIDYSRLTSEISRNYRSTQRLLTGDANGAGLIQQLREAASETLSLFINNTQSPGRLISTQV